MEDSNNVLEIPTSPLSSSKNLSTNEISIRNHSYMISIRVDHLEQPQIEIQVESKEGVDQWKSTFNATAIEKMTAKTGSFKTFDVFVNMLEDAINQKSSSVSIDLFTSNDLQLLRQKQQMSEMIPISKLSTKRYLILIYNVEYDRIYYPLSLRYCGKPDPNILLEQMHRLASENHLLKSQFQTNMEYSDLQEQCARLKKENETFREQLRSYDANEKDRQIDFLRQMIRSSEDALSKERIQAKRCLTKKDDRYKTLLNQIESLKVSERQLKVKVKNLTNEIQSTNKNSPRKVHSRSSSHSHPGAADRRRRYHSANIPRPTPHNPSPEPHVRFNPTAYVHERALKLRQMELQKKRDTRRRLSSGRCQSDSDISDISNQSHDRLQRSKNSRKKRSKTHHRHQSKDSIDSDIERVSSPAVLRKGAFNNSTIVSSPEYSHDNLQNVNSSSVNSMIDIDQRLKSLEKFIKQNFLH